MSLIICKRCGAEISFTEDSASIKCESCGTEYILDTVEGNKILTEYHFENPFVGIDRIFDPELKSLMKEMEDTKDYNSTYNKLIKLKEDKKNIYGYWILRLRAYTEDFNKDYDRYEDFEEINFCVEEHTRYSEFTVKEEDCVVEYYWRNEKSLKTKKDELLDKNVKMENHIKDIINEKALLKNQKTDLNNMINSRENIYLNTKNQHSAIFLSRNLCLIFFIVGIFISIIMFVTVTLIPIAILLVLLSIIIANATIILSIVIKILEIKFYKSIRKRIEEIEARLVEIAKDYDLSKKECLKSFYEYQKTFVMYNLVSKIVRRFYYAKTGNNQIDEKELDSIINQEYTYYAF